jgi:hypothetical protein
MSSTICHAPGPARRAETTSLATERDKFLMVTGFTSNTQKAMLETTALQVVFKLSDNIAWQSPALRR